MLGITSFFYLITKNFARINTHHSKSESAKRHVGLCFLAYPAH